MPVMSEDHLNAGRRQSPNLFLIVVDCLRADRCPTTGPCDDLKAWSRLRANGTAFSQAISSASWTPVCFASLLTGEYSFDHGVRTIHGPAINPDLPTLATVLKAAGYSTHAFVAGPMIDALGMNRGFDEYNHRPRDQFIYGDFGLRFCERFGKISSQDRPWFVMLHLLEVHCPRQTNGLTAREHSIRQYDLAWSQLDKWIDALLERTPSQTVVALTADHAESILRRSDHTLLGRIHRKMRSNLGLSRRGSDWRRHGYHVFDEVMRIPWVISGPGVNRGMVVDQQVRQIDMAATLVDVLGHKFPSGAHGRSVTPLMRGEPMEDAPAYVETGCDEPLRDWHGVRANNWKYAEHPRSGQNIDPEPMLFDLDADPAERRNVVYEHPEIAVEMRRQIDELIHGASRGGGGQDLTEEDQARLTEQLKALGYI